MKKSLILLSCVILMAGFAGCAPREEVKQEENQNPNYAIVNDYENYKEDIEPLVPLNYFGKISLNEDKEYVTSGEKSLKLYPSSDPTQSNLSAPEFRQPLNQVAKELDLSDIRQVSKFTCSVYNTSEKDISMYVSVDFDGGSTFSREFVLKNGWNTVSYSVDPQIIGISYDVSACKGLLFGFDKPQDGEVPTIYMDELAVYKTQEPYTELDLALDDGEIISFDKLYQEYVLYPNTTYAEFAPQLSINSSAAYAKNGYSLKVDLVPNDGTYPAGNYIYTGFTISGDYIGRTNFKDYEDDDIFTFSVYNAGKTQQRLFLEMFTQKNSTYYKKTDIYVKPGEWYTFEATIAELNAQKVNGIKSNGTGDAGSIYFSYELNTLTEAKTLYFDDFKIIKAGE